MGSKIVILPFENRRSPKLERRADRSHRYSESGRRFSSYYRWICLRCGGTFNEEQIVRDNGHERDQCDAQIKRTRELLTYIPDYIIWLSKRLAEHKLMSVLKKAG